MTRTMSLALSLALLAGCGTGSSLAFRETPTPSPTPVVFRRTPVVEPPVPINTYAGTSLCIEIRPGQSPVVCPTPTPTPPTT